MIKNYDAIVIGAGAAGLVCACQLVSNSKKVLIVEGNDYPGGSILNKSIGRFEFESSYEAIRNFGSRSEEGDLRKLLKSLGLLDTLAFVECNEYYKCIFNEEEKEEYILPYGVENYISKLETYVSGSSESVKNFLELAKECKDALSYIASTNNTPLETELKSKYSNFMKVSTYSLKYVMDKLKLPLLAQKIISSNWLEYGSKPEDIDFISYAVNLYNDLSLRNQICYYGNSDIIRGLENKFRELNGDIRYNLKVNHIIINNNMVEGVVLSNGDIINCKEIISNVSPTICYNKLIDKDDVPKNALKLCNQRILGGKSFNVSVGLNKSVDELEFDNYKYVIYGNELVNTLDNDNCVVTIKNKVIPECSPKGTCIINFSTYYFDNCYDEEISSINKYQLEEKMAHNLIKSFEDATGIVISDYIEEINITSPVDYALITGNPLGADGYYKKGFDSLLSRLFNSNEEEYINGLHFCGSFTRSNGLDETLISGSDTAKITLQEIEEGK